jgi:hypothetical protein
MEALHPGPRAGGGLLGSKIRSSTVGIGAIAATALKTRSM